MRGRWRQHVREAETACEGGGDSMRGRWRQHAREAETACEGGGDSIRGRRRQHVREAETACEGGEEFKSIIYPHLRDHRRLGCPCLFYLMYWGVTSLYPSWHRRLQHKTVYNDTSVTLNRGKLPLVQGDLPLPKLPDSQS